MSKTYTRPDRRDAAARLKRWALRYVDMVKDPYSENYDISVAEFADNAGVPADILMRAVREVGG